MIKYWSSKEFNTNLNFLINISCQPDDFKSFDISNLRLFDPTDFMIWNIKGHDIGYKDIGIRKSVFVVAKLNM